MTSKLKKKELKQLLADANTKVSPSQLRDTRRRGKRQADKSLAPQATNQTSSAIGHCSPGPNSSPSIADNVDPVLPSNSRPRWNSVLQEFKGGHAGSSQSLWDWEFRPAMIPLTEMDQVSFSQLGKMDKFEAAQVYQYHAFTILRDAEKDVRTYDDQTSKDTDGLKQELMIAKRDVDKMANLGKLVIHLTSKLEEMTEEKRELESSLVNETKLLNSFKLETSKEKESLEKEVGDVESQIDANYFEGFNCAKNQALLLCPGESKLLQTMCPWGRVKDGKIVEDEEDDDVDDEVPNN